MARQVDTGEYKNSRKDYFSVDPRALVVDWKKNISRAGMEPPVDDELMSLALDMMPRKGPGDDPEGTTGQLNPITCRMLPDRRIEVVGGFRRMRAALWLIESGECPDFQIQYKVVDMNDSEAALANVDENIHRADLSPMQMAHVFRMLHEGYSMPIKDICRRLRKSRSYLAEIIKLTGLPSDIQQSIEKGETPLVAAIELAKFDPSEVRAVFNEAKDSNGHVKAETVKEARRQKQEDTGKGGPVKRSSKHLLAYLESKTGPAELKIGRVLAEVMLAYIAGTKSEKQLDNVWIKAFPMPDASE